MSYPFFEFFEVAASYSSKAVAHQFGAVCRAIWRNTFYPVFGDLCVKCWGGGLVLNGAYFFGTPPLARPVPLGAVPSRGASDRVRGGSGQRVPVWVLPVVADRVQRDNGSRVSVTGRTNV